jgi:threonine dehydrogenase-like Zn-dependent dehydrogenase
MKAWVTYGVNDIRLEEVPDPVARPGWPLVRVLVVQPAITEVQLLRGEQTSGTDLVARRLAEGPQLLFGHEFCGEVVGVAEGETAVAIGDRVTALHSRHGTIGRHFAGCFAELAVLPTDALVVIPDTVDDWSATALQPLSSCVRIVEDLGIGFSDTVIVLGQGVMGLNCAQAAKAAGSRRVIGVDRRSDLLDIARRLGVDETIDATTENVVDRVLALTDGAGAPIVIEAASGSPSVGLSGGSTVSDALACVATGGTILSLAHYHAPVSLDFNICRRKRLRYQFPPTAAQTDDMISAAALVASGRVQLRPMITHRLDGIGSLPDAIEITANKAKYAALNPAQVRIA